MARKRKVVRGDVFVVNFDPTVGSEIKKTRPALVLQNDVANEYGSVTIVAAITSCEQGEKLYPTEVFVRAGEGGLRHDSAILLGQIRTIDKLRLVKKLGKVDEKTMRGVDWAIEISLGLSDL